MDVGDIICSSIGNRHVLSFTYKDSVRSVEPYIFGYDASGVLTLSAVQLSGGSGTGFRTFQVDQLASVRETFRKFIGRHPGYNRRDRLFSRVLCQI
jgi:hypothetical protein